MPWRVVRAHPIGVGSNKPLSPFIEPYRPLMPERSEGEAHGSMPNWGISGTLCVDSDLYRVAAGLYHIDTIYGPCSHKIGEGAWSPRGSPLPCLLWFAFDGVNGGTSFTAWHQVFDTRYGLVRNADNM